MQSAKKPKSEKLQGKGNKRYYFCFLGILMVVVVRRSRCTREVLARVEVPWIASQAWHRGAHQPCVWIPQVVKLKWIQTPIAWVSYSELVATKPFSDSVPWERAARACQIAKRSCQSRSWQTVRGWVGLVSLSALHKHTMVRIACT